MDSRWRFLHYSISELRGRRKGSRAGNEKTGASGDRSTVGKTAVQSEDVTRSEQK